MSRASEKEALLPLNTDETRIHHRHHLDRIKTGIVVVLLGVVATISLLRSGPTTIHPTTITEFPITLPVSTELQRKWGPYTPWYAAEAYQPPPDHCTVTQANILQRHDARYPTSGAARRIVDALDKLLSAREYTHPSLRFLKEYKYDLGKDVLVEYGAARAKYSGRQAFMRYQHLVGQDDIPFVRASGKERVIDSATNWTLGFAEASKHKYIPKLNVILDENLNDTLDNSQCPNAGDSDPQTEIWINHFGSPITDRLNSYAPGSNLTPSDIFSLMLICPFESVAHVSLSPFCPTEADSDHSIFTLSEFSSLSYTFDLDKFYNTGYGQPLGRVQGVGYVNELLARLQNKPVRDHTQTNTTLDSNRKTFPLDRSVYIDFTHDNEMVAVYGAVGLFKQEKVLDPHKMENRRTWMADRLVPFGSRMVTEKMECGRKEYVRILVNDALQPLEFCGGEGLCELKRFVKSQKYARHDGEGDWEQCFG
ncbi:Histidine phosphatase superfamily [Amanita muscaria]